MLNFPRDQEEKRQLVAAEITSEIDVVVRIEELLTALEASRARLYRVLWMAISDGGNYFSVLFLSTLNWLASSVWVQ